MSTCTPASLCASRPSLRSRRTFDLGDYRGITITYSEPEVTDADVAERLEQLRDQKAEYVNEDPRPLADGDYAVISLESLSGVAEKISQDELVLKIGDEADHAGVYRESARSVAG